MDTATAQKLIYEVYIPFVIAFVSIAVPMVSLLLSIFSQGRDEIARDQQAEIDKLASGIQANEVSKRHSVVKLFIQLLSKRGKLLLLSPYAYLPLLTIPPVASVAFALLALQSHFTFFVALAGVAIALFFLLLWNFIILVADITARREADSAERNRTTLETLQSILKAVDPGNQRVKNFSIRVNDEVVGKGTGDITFPAVVLGKEAEWKVAFCNDEATIPAKRVEVGLQFPVKEFTIKKQSEYSLYEPDNIVRFNEEYVDQQTNLFFSTPVTFTPMLTGTHDIKLWVKGENIETVYFTAHVSVEIAA